MQPTCYRIFPLDPHAHLFEVHCTVADPDPAGQRFRLPAWIPGSYLVREFARQFIDVRAESDGKPIALHKEAKDVWRAAPMSAAGRSQGANQPPRGAAQRRKPQAWGDQASAAGPAPAASVGERLASAPLTVIAHVYAFDLSVRTAYLDATRGYFNGPSVFLCPEGRESAPCTLDIVAPEGEAYAAWRVATTLTADGAAAHGFGRYRAESYDELIDHPVEMSDFAFATFAAGGAHHEIAVTGRQDTDLERLARDLARVCQWQIELFGGSPESAAPFDRYLFQVTAVGEGHGGLEHRTSTSLLCRRDELPARGRAEITDEYVDLLGLASHEYFHSWNVKRIKPAAFVPYDLARENYTRQLWAFEGITSYYDDLALVRSGIIEAPRYLELIGRTITSVLRTPGRHRQSIAEASFDAWIKFYRPDENSPNAGISYYQKGSLVALALDLMLRHAGRTSLDAVMRTLWERHGRTGSGVTEDGIERIVEELAGGDMREFFDRYVRGTADPPLDLLLEAFGVEWHVRASSGPNDRGGKPAAGPLPACWLGAKIGNDQKLQTVYSGGPAERAGLAPGDALAALDGVRATPEALKALLSRRGAGERIRVHTFRRDELIDVELELAGAPLDTCYLSLRADAPPEALALRAGWLKGA